MDQVNVKVSFYLKKSETDADRMYPVMARLNIGKYSDGFQREIPCAAVHVEFGTCLG